MSLHAYVDAHKNGYDENMFLDPATRTYVEETGGANFFFVTEDGELVIPKSDSIYRLYRRSVITVAGMLGIKVTERPVKLEEIGNFCRKRTVWNCSSHLSSRQDYRSWKRDCI